MYGSAASKIFQLKSFVIIEILNVGHVEFPDSVLELRFQAVNMN